jgi:hypothetical protein
MSEIRVTTLKDTSGGNSSSTADIFSGRAKAWVNFNGQGAVAIRANFNVNSITDNGTGDYAVNFTNALTDANYCAVASCNSIGSVNSSSNSTMVFARSGATNANPSTTSMACCAFHPPNTVNQDVGYYLVSVFR